MQQAKRSKRKAIKVDAVTMILAIIAVAMVVTWIVPGGELTFSEQGGETTAVFAETARTPVLPWQLPLLLVNSVSKSLSIIILVIAGEIMVIAANEAGTIDAFIGHLCKSYVGKEKKLIVLFVVFFALLGVVIPPQCFIGFVPTIIILMESLGYDAILGLAVTLIGSSSSSFLSPISTITAMCQETVGLPIFSGFAVRTLSFALIISITIAYFLNYANKIKADPAKSFLYNTSYKVKTVDRNDVRPVKTLDWVNFGVIGVIFIMAVIGSSFWDWGMEHISAAILTSGIIIALISKASVKKIMLMCAKGIGEASHMILIIILANTVGLILTKSNVVNTIIYYSADVLNHIPSFLIPTGMLALITVLNFVIPSGAAKALLLLPILSPIGRLVGLSSQTCVLTYAYGDGFSNFIMPHDSGNASFLAAAHIDYTIWMKFMLRLFWLWNIVGVVMLTVLYYVGYGPF